MGFTFSLHISFLFENGKPVAGKSERDNEITIPVLQVYFPNISPLWGATSHWILFRAFQVVDTIPLQGNIKIGQCSVEHGLVLHSESVSNQYTKMSIVGIDLCECSWK